MANIEFLLNHRFVRCVVVPGSLLQAERAARVAEGKEPRSSYHFAIMDLDQGYSTFSGARNARARPRAGFPSHPSLLV